MTADGSPNNVTYNSHWEARCMSDPTPDTQALGVASFNCIKEQCPYELRVFMMRAFMMTPFVVNQLINMLVKTGLPRWIHGALKEEPDKDKLGTGCYFGLCKLLGCILGHGGMRLRSEKCPKLPVTLYEPEPEEGGGVGGVKPETMDVVEVDGVVTMDTTGDGQVDTVGIDTTGDGHVDVVKNLTQGNSSKRGAAGMKRRPSELVKANSERSLANKIDPNKHFVGKEVDIEQVVQASLLWDFNEFNEQLGEKNPRSVPWRGG
jgi:hypothetical protein